MYNRINHPLPALAGRLSRESRQLIAGVLALVISLLENRFRFRLFPFDAAWAAIAVCGWPTLSAAVRRRELGAEALFALCLGIVVASGHIPAAGVLALVYRLALDRKDQIAASACRETEALASSLPAFARQMIRGRQSYTDADSLRPGDVIRVLPGETVPADGVVLSGPASYSTFALNGAVLPVGRQPGGRVPSGAAALDAPFTMRVEAAAFDSTAQRLLRLRREEETGLLRRSDRRAAAAEALVLTAGLLSWLYAGDGLLTVAMLSAGAFAVPAAALPRRNAARSLTLRREID